MKFQARSKIGWLAGLALAATALAACSPATATPAAGEAVTPAPAATDSALVAEGRLAPRWFVDVAFATGGQVSEVLVSEGALVVAGQPLARLAGTALAQADVARAELAVLEAQQALEALARGAGVAVAQAELDVAAAERGLEAAEEALAELKSAKDDAPEDEQPTDAQVAQAAAQVAIQRAVLAVARAEAERMAAGEGDAAARALAEQRLATAEAGLAAAEAALESRTLTAPAGGTVVGLQLKVGQHVTAGQPALTLADFSEWVVLTEDLTELEVARVAPGQAVQVTFDGLPGVELNGELERLEQRYEEKRGDITFTGTVALLAGSDAALRWGLTAAVWFEQP